MSSNDEGVEEGGQFGPSGLSGESVGAMLAIARHLAATAAGHSGGLKASAEIHLALRDGTKRAKLFENVLLEICPNGADEKVLLSWLEGGPSPFPKKVSKTGPGEEKPAQTLKRSSDRVRTLRSKIDKRKSELDALQVDLEYVERYENAAVHYYVVDHLIRLIEPVFAMGPAWTIMRALSGHLPEAVAAEATEYFSTKEKTMVLKPMTAERERDSEKMFEVLDFFSGVAAFEEALRGAVSNVCKDFDSRRDELVKDGRRPRSKERVRTEVHPKAQHEATEVLGGLKQAS